MFKVIHKATMAEYAVYDIKYDASGNAHFLIFADDTFTTVHSKHFRPKKGLFSHE